MAVTSLDTGQGTSGHNALRAIYREYDGFISKVEANPELYKRHAIEDNIVYWKLELRDCIQNGFITFPQVRELFRRMRELLKNPRLVDPPNPYDEMASRAAGLGEEITDSIHSI